MATAIARLAQPQGKARDDQHKGLRLVAQRRGHLNSAEGESALVAIGDVSPHGCSVQCASGRLRFGQFVSLSLEEGAALQAVVRWVREDHAGLEFLHAVPADYRDWRALMDLDA